MTLREKILLFCVLTFFTLNLAAQDQAKVDSLKNLLVSADGENRYHILIDLSSELIRLDAAQALEYTDEAIAVARELEKTNLEIEALISDERQVRNLKREIENRVKDLNLKRITTGYCGLYWRKYNFDLYRQARYILQEDRNES